LVNIKTLINGSERQARPVFRFIVSCPKETAAKKAGPRRTGMKEHANLPLGMVIPRQARDDHTQGQGLMKTGQNMIEGTM
jgi:hypothetical protein